MQTILIADDNRATRKMLSAALRHAGYQVLEAADGKEAYQTICQHQPDAVLLDICMPGMTGLKVCRLMKKNQATRNIPVACMTANQSSEHLLAAREAGAAFCWFKPLPMRDVLCGLRQMTREKSSLEAPEP
jgi:CheY-like chemotaxis protein